MAPGYNNYSNYWDPANSQAQNQQGYSYASQTNTTPQYSDSRAANANQQTSSYADSYANPNTYGRGWYDTNAQQSSAEDNRAVESLAQLNNQDNGQYAAAARSNATPAYTSSSWSTTQYPSVSATATSNASQARDVATSIASPQTTYSTARPTSAYTSTQSYQRPESTTSYSQAAYSTVSAQYRQSQSKVTSPPTTYTHATHSQVTNQAASTTPATSQYTTPATSQYSTVPARTSTTAQFRPSSPYQPQTHARKPSNSQSASTTDKGWATASKPTSQVVRQTQANQNYPRSITPSQVHQQAQDAHRHSTSAEPSNPVTVDPTQVYDPWPEQQRKAQAAAEQRRKMEAERAKKEAEQQEVERKRREEEEQRAAEEAARVQAEADKDKLEAAHGLAMAAAAMSAEAAAGGDMEAQMRAMFQKMREFNAKDPSMLARLWEEERQQHVTSGSPTPSAQPSASKTAGTAGASSSSVQASTTTPFAKAKPSSAKKAKAASKSKAKSTPSQAQSPAAPLSAVPVPTAVSSAVLSAVSSAAPAPAPVTASPVVPPPATTQSGQAATTSTIWPHGKKTQIAQAASKWLNDRNEASGKTVQASDVFLMLDSNPSYTTLCESLEGLGLIVDRGPFARALLQAVPDISKAHQSHNAQSNPASVNKIVDAAQAPASASTHSAMAKSAAKRKDRSNVASPAPGAVNGSQPQWTQPMPATASQSLVDMYRTAVDTSPVHAQAPSQANSPAGSVPPALRNSTGAQSPYFPQPPRPPPRNKAEAARKRNFSELVDLTAGGDSDNDDVPPPPKQPNLSQFGMSTLSPPADLDAAPQATVNTRQAPSFAHQGVPSMADKLKNQILVQPILRSKVARKSRYDPRTIARDVLLATGRHPTMRALNQHLMGLQELLMTHSEGVELNKFDLSTLRWDLIDPGDPVVEMEDDDKSEEDVDADDEGDGVPAPARIMQRMDHGDGTVSAVEIRAPAPILKGMGTSKRGRGRPPTTYSVQSRGRPPKAYTNQSRGPPYSVPMQTNSLGSGQPVNQPNSAPGNRAPRNTATHTANWMTPSSAADFTRGSTNQSDSGSPAVGYSAFKSSQVQYDAEGNPIKRRGRPVGWRKAIHSRAANGLEGGQSSAHDANGAEQSHSEKVGQGRKRGPKPGSQLKTKPEPFPEPDPHFNVYECRFRGCRAQLHNLDTMKKHVLKVHGVPNRHGKYECNWMHCRAEGNDASGKGKAPADNPATFDTIQDWSNHLEDAHFLGLARALGDGPRGGLSDHYDSEASEAYMSDRATGRIITPRATPMESLAEDAVQQSQLLAPVHRRGMPRVRGRLSVEQRDDELKLQQLEARRLRVGPGMDRTGVRFATEERRAGLYDDEEFEGAYSPDDGPDDDDDG